MTMCDAQPGRPEFAAREQGITIIEVMIAVLMLMVVASSIVLATVSSADLRGASRVQVAMTAAGQQAQQDISTDRRWMRSCTLGRRCDVRDSIEASTLELLDIDGDAEVVTATAVGLDSNVDGVANADDDGIVPDFFRITVELRLAARTAARYGLRPDDSVRRFVTTIDRAGEEQVGSLAVEVCRVLNQADERLQVQGCAQRGSTDLPMMGCPPSPRPGCEPAWDWIADIERARGTPPGPSPFVSLERVPTAGYGFQLVNASTGASIPSSQAKIRDGIFVFQNVPAGEFHLRGLPASVGARTERWRSKELPTYHRGSGRASIVVDPGIRNRALVVYRPTRTGSIDLFFNRRTRTYTLRGPFTSRQVHVPKMAPTHGYQGAGAAEACAFIKSTRTDSPSMAGASYDCVGIVPEGQHCVLVKVSGTVWDQVATGAGTHYLVHDVGSYVSAVEITPEMRENGGSDYEYVMRTVTNATAARFCTYYAEYFTHTYYGHVPGPRWRTRDGAARGDVTYYVEPKPDARHLEDDGNGMYLEIPRCTTVDRGQCAPTSGVGAVALRDGIAPGLNSGLLVPPTDDAPAAVIEHFRGRRHTVLAGDGIWARTNGEMVTPQGRYRGARQTFTGMGECYWLSPRYAGEAEGPCDPCRPMWTRTQTYSGCSILTRTDWERPAWESVENYDWPVYGGPVDYYIGEIEGKSGTINYDPPWQCSSLRPLTGKPATCRPQATGGGGDRRIGTTRHRSNKSGGSGIVLGLSMGTGAST